MSERAAWVALVLAWVVLPATAFATELPPELGAWVREGEARTFAGGALYEHIDGGAELYHEYGFVALRVGYYALGDREILVEVYEMASPDAAHALYSMLRDPSAAALGEPRFGSRYDLYDECLHGSEYMKLAAAATVTAEDRLAVLEALVPAPVAPAPLELGVALPTTCAAGSEVSIRGPLALQGFARLGDGARFGVGDAVHAAGCRVELAGEPRRWLVLTGPEEDLGAAVEQYLAYQTRSGLEVVEDKGVTLVGDPLSGKVTVVVAAPGRVTVVSRLPADVAASAGRRIKALAKGERAAGP